MIRCYLTKNFQIFVTLTESFKRNMGISPVESQNDLELDFKVFFFVDSCCAGIVLDESN